MKWVSASEIVIFHDRILQLYPGVAGMPDAGRAEAIIHRVHNLAHYEGVNDVFDLAAAYWVAIARGRIFNDGNADGVLYHHGVSKAQRRANPR